MRILLFTFWFLTACVVNNAAPTSFNAHEIQANSFLLTSYERIGRKGGAANVYIEGDGRAWLNKSRASLDPTPKNPLALRLAKIDLAANVIYLARPCQYSRGAGCKKKYWTSHRFAPEVIEAMDKALDDMKRRHQITKFNLIGYSGGGNIAALLTARRDNVLSLRTVAGNLDHELQSKIHQVSLMPESLNAKDIAKNIKHIPQIHFIGAKDKIVPIDLVQSYKSGAGSKTNCVQIANIPNVSHHKGWEENWRRFLDKKLPICN